MALKLHTHDACMTGLFVWLCGCGALVLVLSTTSVTAAEVQLWNFDGDQPGKVPLPFQIGTLFDGRPAGDWQVTATDKATSPPYVLAQLQGKGAEHAYKLVLAQGTESENIDLSVKLLPIDGKADMGGGLIWRATDDRNYYLARANPLEQNIRIYRVVKGVRHMIQNFDHVIDVRRWHHLRVRMDGCNIQVSFDDRPVFKLCDETFSKGRIGLWTKSDAVTYFDDVSLSIGK
ncbi:MAG TPA: hypothetical protein PKD12_15765 [Nitrospira sp.]|nr:hypothetical protein [Nitrospira sp.]HMS85103.1 hypothetical protein [Nitrospira sp.]